MRLTPEQIEELQADYNIEPWGGVHAEVLAAYVRRDSLLPHLKGDPPDIRELMPFSGKPKPLPTEDELAAKVGAVTGYQG